MRSPLPASLLPAEYPREISGAALAQLPIRRYEGEVCLVSQPQDLERALAAIFLGIRIPKGNRTSNWAAPRLSPAQITYAATDAWACRELFLCYARLGLLGAQPVL